MGSGRAAILFDALDVSGRTRLGEADLAEVRALAEKAEQQLDMDDPARRAIADFAAEFEAHRYDLPALERIGFALHDQMDRLAMPIPPGNERRDING